LKTGSSENIAKKIFSLINLKKDIDYQDPDFGMILKKIRTIPEQKVVDFYEYIVDRKESFNNGGILKRNEISPSVREFMDKISKEIWEKHRVKEKSELISSKVISIYINIVKPKTQQEQFEFFKNPSLKNLIVIGSKGEKSKLLSGEELEVIAMWGIENAMNKASQYGAFEVKEGAEYYYKSLFTKKYVTKHGEEEVQNKLAFRLPEPKRF